MTPSVSTTLCGLVLAGGRSTRMGRDKAALVHPDGRTLAHRCYDLLAEAGCATVVLSLRHDQEVPEGFADLAQAEIEGEVGGMNPGEPRPVVIVRDPEGASQGPLAGMLAAMRLMPEADWLVLACDLPRLDLATLSHLIEARRPDEPFLSYRSEFDGLPEPLCALYGAAARLIIEQEQGGGVCCPRKVLIRHHCRLLEPCTAGALDNANTPEDWSNAIAP